MDEPPVSRQRSVRTPASLRDLTLIVRPPGRPALIRVFTEQQRREAEQYAKDFDGIVEDLL
jgi:hypothetical protein